jgi:uncharacterized LabA/DUF88 family protein
MLALPEERIGVFIDGPSLYRASRTLKFSVDFKRLLMLFRQRGHLVRAHYYSTVAPDSVDCSVRPLLDWLSYNGFTVVTKAVNDFSDPAAHHALAIELVIDAMLLADRLDHFVLFSGHGDFRSLVAALQGKGRRVSVISTLHGEPALVADGLRRQADNFLELEELRPILSREVNDVAAGDGR